MTPRFEEILAKLKEDPANARFYAVQLYELGWEERTVNMLIDEKLNEKLKEDNK